MSNKQQLSAVSNTFFFLFFYLVGVEVECHPVSTRLQYGNINGCVAEKEVPISHCEVNNKNQPLSAPRPPLSPKEAFSSTLVSLQFLPSLIDLGLISLALIS